MEEKNISVNTQKKDRVNIVNPATKQVGNNEQKPRRTFGTRRPQKQNDRGQHNQNNHQEQNLEIGSEKPQISVPVKGEKGVKITFLGGVGEIGKNMTAIEYGDEMIVVDAGLTFPGDDLPGVDLVVPDISYLLMNKAKIKAIILTHGHEDHIGGMPFLMNEIKAPIYGSRLTLALVENKLNEHRVPFKAVAVKPRNVLKIGAFTIEFIKVSHSIAGSLALHITTPVGNIIHTGDFKIDFQPIDGEMTDLIRFGEIGKKGVSLLLCESTNVCRKGYSMSESNVGKVLDGLFEKNLSKRLFVATFASNIHRMQQVMDLAVKYKRKVAFTGRSMVNISETALKIGELHFDKNILVDIDKIDKYADNELVILTTGSQGESMSALSRMAADNFPKIKICENDTIIFSSSPIPGNEKSVYRVINALFKKGADVIYDELADVHVSGHACQEEIKTIHALINPKFFIPVHGEYRHLKRHEELAIEMGMDKKDILLPDLGMQVELGRNYLKKCGQVIAGQRLVDGSGVGDMESSVLKDRRQLSEEGFCVVALNMECNEKGELPDPCIITRGLVYDEEQEEMTKEMKALINQSLLTSDIRNLEVNELKQAIRRIVSSYINKKTKRRPMILTIVFNN